MAEPALDDVQRHSLSDELHGVGVAQLMGSGARPDDGLGGVAAKLAADGGGRPGPPAAKPPSRPQARRSGKDRCAAESCMVEAEGLPVIEERRGEDVRLRNLCLIAAGGVLRPPAARWASGRSLTIRGPANRLRWPKPPSIGPLASGPRLPHSEEMAP
jgi:hypothetical protein